MGTYRSCEPEQVQGLSFPVLYVESMHSSPSKPAHYPPFLEVKSPRLAISIHIKTPWTLPPKETLRRNHKVELNPQHSSKHLRPIHVVFFPSHNNNSGHPSEPWLPATEPSGPSFPKTFDSRRRGSNRSERRVRGASSCGAFSSRRISSTWRFRRWFS